MLPLTPPGSDLLMPDLPENSQVCPSIAMHAPDPSSPTPGVTHMIRDGWLGLQAGCLALQYSLLS